MKSMEELQREAYIDQLQTKHRTNHILHLILTICTVGIWLPFWFIVAMSNLIERRKITWKEQV